MYSQRKTFLFRNKKVVDHIERQPHQSAYLENLVLKDTNSQQPITKDEVIKLIKEYTNGCVSKSQELDIDIQNSILSVLK